MTRLHLLWVAAAIAAGISCGPAIDPPPEPVQRMVVLGPASMPAAIEDEDAPSLRTPLDADGIAWITGIHADADAGVEVLDAGVTLDVEVDLIRVSEDAPSFALPPGFGVSAARALDALPERWRGLRVTTRARARGGRAADGAVRVTLDTLGPEATGRIFPVWRVPVAIGPRARVISAPDGATRVATRLSEVLPAPGTIHGLVPRSGGRAIAVRVVDRGDGAIACALERRTSEKPLGAWSDPAGIAVGSGARWWLEFDLPPGAEADGVAVDVYLRTEGDLELRYPRPDELGPAER